MGVASFPPSLLALIAGQFGVVGRCQLLDHVSHGTASGLVRRGALEAVERGVYRVRGGASHPAQPAMAAVLRARPGAVVSGPLVLGLLGVDGFAVGDPFEVLVRPGRVPANVAFAWRTNPTPDAATAMVQRLPIVRPTIALVDSGRWIGRGLTPRQLRAGYDAARWKGLTSSDRVRERSDLLGPSDPGAAFFLRLFEDGVAVPESEPERTTGELLQVFEPPPEPQVWVSPAHRPDWFFRLYRLGVDYLGRVDHQGADQRAGDRARELELADIGVRIVTVTAEDLLDHDGFLAWMEFLLCRRARELGVPPPTRRR